MIFSKRKHIDDDSTAQRGFASVRRVQVNVISSRDELFQEPSRDLLAAEHICGQRKSRVVCHLCF